MLVQEFVITRWWQLIPFFSSSVKKAFLIMLGV